MNCVGTNGNITVHYGFLKCILGPAAFSYVLLIDVKYE